MRPPDWPTFDYSGGVYDTKPANTSVAWPKEVANMAHDNLVFVVVRFDSQWRQFEDESLFTVIEVLPDEDSAIREVNRLNVLNGRKQGPRYSFQTAPWHSLGKEPID